MKMCFLGKLEHAPLSRSLSPSLLSLSLCLSISLFLSPYLSRALSPSLSYRLSLSISLSLSCSLSFSLCHCLSLHLSLSLPLSLSPSLSLSLSLFHPPSLSLSLSLGTVEVWYRGGRGCGIGRRHLRGERGCLPDRCRAPQRGRTPLHLAADEGHAAVVGQLLAAKADMETKNHVKGQGG